MKLFVVKKNDAPQPPILKWIIAATSGIPLALQFYATELIFRVSETLDIYLFALATGFFVAWESFFYREWKKTALLLTGVFALYGGWHELLRHINQDNFISLFKAFFDPAFCYFALLLALSFGNIRLIFSKSVLVQAGLGLVGYFLICQYVIDNSIHHLYLTDKDGGYGYGYNSEALAVRLTHYSALALLLKSFCFWGIYYGFVKSPLSRIFSFRHTYALSGTAKGTDFSQKFNIAYLGLLASVALLYVWSDNSVSRYIEAYIVEDKVNQTLYFFSDAFRYVILALMLVAFFCYACIQLLLELHQQKNIPLQWWYLLSFIPGLNFAALHKLKQQQPANWGSAEKAANFTEARQAVGLGVFIMIAIYTALATGFAWLKSQAIQQPQNFHAIVVISIMVLVLSMITLFVLSNFKQGYWAIPLYFTLTAGWGWYQHDEYTTFVQLLFPAVAGCLLLSILWFALRPNADVYLKQEEKLLQSA